jgi:hypothetical protein
MVYLDTLCFNMDRHTYNYGILRNVENGAVLGMAPNFDNNIALVSRGYNAGVNRESDRLIGFFTEFLENNEDAIATLVDMDIPVVERSMIESCMGKVPVEADRQYIREYILNGQAILTATIERIMRENSPG